MSCRNRLFYIVLFFLLIGIVFVRYKMVVDKYNDNTPQSHITGRIVTNPVSRNYGQSFDIETKNNFRLLVRNTSQDSFEYNDTIYLIATCLKPDNFETDLGSTFDYITYLKKDHVYYVCKSDSIKLLKRQKSIVGQLYKLSNYIADQIQNTFTNPHAAFIGGVLVGDKTTIDPNIRNDFIKTGTIHIIALSGYNIAIVALFFQYIFVRLFRKKLALVISGLSVIVFVIMTGFMASAIRAGLMAIIVIFSQFTYQRYSAVRALLFVSLLMVIYDPFYLLYDSSFHLSFLATYGVIVLSPLCELYLTQVSNKVLRTTISTTLGAYIMTLPYLLYFFQGLSVTGILTNIIILPLIPLFMLVGSISLGISFVSMQLSFVPSLITQYLSQIILWIIHLFAQIPFGYIPINVNVWVFIGLYLLIFYFMYRTKKKVDLSH